MQTKYSIAFMRVIFMGFQSLLLVTIMFLVKLLQNKDIRNKNIFIFILIFQISNISSLTFEKDFISLKNDKTKNMQKKITTYKK